MLHSLIAEFLGTALMILFGVGVHCDEVLTKTKYHGSGHIFAITTWAFGISVTLFIFGGVCINPAMALCQAILGMIPWSNFIPYCIAEFLGALFGSLVVYVMYADHFKASEGKIDPIAIRNIFSTNPNCRNLPRNFFVETIATTVFLTAILAVATNYEKQLPYRCRTYRLGCWYGTWRNYRICHEPGKGLRTTPCVPVTPYQK